MTGHGFFCSCFIVGNKIIPKALLKKKKKTIYNTTPSFNLIRIFILMFALCILKCMVIWIFMGSIYLSPRVQVSCLLQVCVLQWNGSSLHHVSKQASSFLQWWVSVTGSEWLAWARFHPGTHLHSHTDFSAWLKDTLMTCSVWYLVCAALNHWP